MNKKQGGEIPEDLERVSGQFEDWRAQRRHGQRIPKELWGAAVKAARRHGLNMVSVELGLDYSCLKRRLEGGAKRQPPEACGELFVEVDPGNSNQTRDCVVELEKGNGAKLRVCVRDAATVDWCQLKEAFLGA